MIKKSWIHLSAGPQLVITLGKLLTPTCLYRCMWFSGWCQLITSGSQFYSHCGSFASDLEQVANRLCAQVKLSLLPLRKKLCSKYWTFNFRLPLPFKYYGLLKLYQCCATPRSHGSRNMVLKSPQARPTQNAAIINDNKNSRKLL